MHLYCHSQSTAAGERVEIFNQVAENACAILPKWWRHDRGRGEFPFNPRQEAAETPVANAKFL
jgi:hypothetical protein